MEVIMIHVGILKIILFILGDNNALEQSLNVINAAPNEKCTDDVRILVFHL
jgi:hypothetical protein